MNGKNRSDIRPGLLVDIVLKKDQPTGKLTRGHVKRVLTNSASHPRGIKVMLLEENQVGRVRNIPLNEEEQPYGRACKASESREGQRAKAPDGGH